MKRDSSHCRDVPFELVIDVSYYLLERVGIVDRVAETWSVDNRQSKFDASFLNFDGRSV